MNILKIAAFTYNQAGGNPAGVVIGEVFPSDADMLKIAKQVGYSETAFLKPAKEGWRIRYFAPEIEIPFCGHATIASGAALGKKFGEGVYKLFLNTGSIKIDVRKTKGGYYSAALQSPETTSFLAPKDFVADILAQFNFGKTDIDPSFPVHFASAGAKHLIIVLKSRETLAAMQYEFGAVQNLMLKAELATINLVWPQSEKRFHARNPFASGGVYEDPATGAAAAAFAGYLRDINWQGSRKFDVIQGEDMGSASRILVTYTSEPGSSVNIFGETRIL